MRIRNIAVFSAAIFVGAVCGSLIGPRPVAAVAREIIDLQRDVTSLLQGQKDLSTQMTQDHTVIKTIVGGFNDTSAASAAAWARCKNPFRTSRPTPARVSTRCPRKFTVSRTISRKSS